MEGQKGGVSGITEKTKKARNVMQVADQVMQVVGRPAYTQYTENDACLHAHATHTQVKHIEA